MDVPAGLAPPEGPPLEASVETRIAAEAKLRGLTEQKLETLYDAVSEGHTKTVKYVSDMQQVAIDHSEVLRRLDGLDKKKKRAVFKWRADGRVADLPSNGWTPLYAAASYNHLEVVTLLLSLLSRSRSRRLEPRYPPRACRCGWILTEA